MDFFKKMFDELVTFQELRDDEREAGDLQKSLLPSNHHEINGIKFCYAYKPSLYLSGDFIDYVPLNEHMTMFYLADVSGHGTGSAFITVLLKNLTNRCLRDYNRGTSFDILSPAAFVKRLNRALLDTVLRKHLTIFCGVIDSRLNRMVYVSGGHHPMPILHMNDEFSFLNAKGMAVGLMDELNLNEMSLDLSGKFVLSVFSDGILEIMTEKNLKDKKQQLLSLVSEHDHEDEIWLKKMMPSHAPDDISMLKIKGVF